MKTVEGLRLPAAEYILVLLLYSEAGLIVVQ